MSYHNDSCTCNGIYGRGQNNCPRHGLPFNDEARRRIDSNIREIDQLNRAKRPTSNTDTSGKGEV